MYICSMYVCICIFICICMNVCHVTLQLKPPLSSLEYKSTGYVYEYVVESDSVFLGEPFIARLLKRLRVLTI